MDLRQLEYFVAVAEERSFTGGARRVRIVQSAVSAAIRKLERDLGAVLFDRSGSWITLTDAGAALLPKAQEVLAVAQRARDAVVEVRGGLRGTVNVGALLTLKSVDLAAILGRFHAAHPDVTIRMRTSPAGSGGHLQAVADGELDVAVVATLEPRAGGVRLQHFADDPLRLVVPAEHPLAGSARIGIRQLGGETFAGEEGTTGATRHRGVAQPAVGNGLKLECEIQAADAGDEAGHRQIAERVPGYDAWGAW
ncbi:LysR family transcriptional regulator [Micromonospora sp. NPDC005324]|uniref:LysR family transcriptional regulator n=1 Tax=Micromonospora sp. NPDC005324 TaxID=3157033 RepID=UPI0033A7DD1E